MNGAWPLTAAERRPEGWVIALLILPWVQPWAPGPEPNTVPLLLSGACLALLLTLGRWPTAMELARAWVIAALLSSVIGLLQYFGEAALLRGWAHVPATLGEAMGNLRQRNQLATQIGIGAVGVLWWQTQGLRRRHALWMLALLALGHAATRSRTGLLQWLVLMPLLLGLWQAHVGPGARAHLWSWPLVLWAMGLDLLAGLGLPHALAQWHGIEVSSALGRLSEMTGCSSRRVLWANVWQLVLDKPWTGWGPDQLKYAHYMADYPGVRFCEILGNAHNLPLQMAFVWGLPVALVMCGGGLIWLLRARPWRLQRPTDSLAWGVLAMVGLHSLLEYPLWYGPFQLAVLAAVVLLWPQANAWLRRPPPRLRMTGAALLLLLGWIALDYARVRQIYLPATERWSVWRADPWQNARQTWFFKSALRFAELTSTPVTDENAQAQLQASLTVLRYSPEPRVIHKLIDSARRSGQDELAHWHLRQKQRAYPDH